MPHPHLHHQHPNNISHSPASSADSRILDIDDTVPPSSSTATTNTTTTTAATTPSTNVFPRGSTTVSNIRIEREPLISPALSGFTFNLDPDPPLSPPICISAAEDEVASISFSDPLSFSFSKPAITPLPHAVSPPPTRQIRSMTSDGSEVSRSESTSRRVEYFNNVFSNGSGTKESAKERVQRESPIIAELRTNVIIKDEYTAITSLSQHLSERYRRPESAIILTVTHSTCLMMGGSFEPAYILDITAIPSEVQPVTNKRNAYLIQCFVAEVLHVPSNRGVVRFSGLEEEKLATNGSTVAGEIERAEKDAAAVAPSKEEKPNGIVRSLTSKSSRMSMIADKRKSLGPVTEKENRKSIMRLPAVERKESDGAKSDTVFQTIERKFSTRSLRSRSSVKSLKDKISPPIPTEFPAELLPSPTSLSGFSMSASPKTSHFPDLPKIHRLSPLHGLGRNSPAPRDRDAPPPSPSPLSQNPPTTSGGSPPVLPPLSSPSPSPPRTAGPGTEKEPLVTSNKRRPQSAHARTSSSTASIRPQSARKNLSNITGRAGAIPSPPPIPPDVLDVPGGTTLKHKLSKRKSFVSLFQRKSADMKAA